MKRTLLLVLVAGAAIGCSDDTSPTGPAAVRADSLASARAPKPPPAPPAAATALADALDRLVPALGSVPQGDKLREQLRALLAAVNASDAKAVQRLVPVVRTLLDQIGATADRGTEAELDAIRLALPDAP